MLITMAKSEKPVLNRVGRFIKKNIMANINTYVVINATGSELNTTVNEQVISLAPNALEWYNFPTSGESIDVEIKGSSAKTINVGAGTVSYTVMQFTNTGWANIFPSTVNDRVSI